MKITEPETYADPDANYGIGRKFPDDWTDEQVIAWNNANCTCPFHAAQRTPSVNAQR